jgi:tetratricopeptide (TPR) repeat protein
MRRSPTRIFLPALALATVVACSTKKDAFLNRTFHRLVSRDNGWFNANEKLNETVAAMQKAYVDDYDQVLPIFVIGTEEQAKAIVPDMETCIEKCAIVIDRNSMEFDGKEKNNWIDDAWFVIGKSHFYKRSYLDAERTFEYIGRRFKGQDKQMEAKLWLARTAIQLEEYAKAQSALDAVKNEKVLPKHFPHDQLSAIQADLELHRGKTDDAIISLEHAVQIADRKQDRVRWSFILAQLYQFKGQDDKAIAQYREVTRMGPPYEMGFHAQIFQALAFGRGDSKGIRKKLERMLRDEKNIDHFDLIHYALADLDLKENHQDEAIAELQESIRSNTVDTRQKAKSFLRLADLYFDDRKYPSAQSYYDSTSTVLAADHPRFDEVKTRAEVLGDLVVQLNIIAHEDSLQAFAKLDPEEQRKRVQAMIRDREREEADKAQAESDARDVVASNAIAPNNPGNPASGGAWYFYNPVQIARGIADFKKKWGNRPNADDWRRADKSGTALVDVAEEQELPADAVTAEKANEPAWKDPDTYLKGLPTDAAGVDSSNARICHALYIAGMIYKEKLKDVDNAIESFEVLNNRFDDCRFTAESYYQLYRIYLAKEKEGGFMDFGGSSSKGYADQILQRWPDSEFARLVRDPDQLQADEAAKVAESQAYEELYRQFKQGSYRGVIATCEGVMANEPHNHLLAKYGLLKALSLGGLHLTGPFHDALLDVKNGFPGSDEAKVAGTMLADLDRLSGAAPETKPVAADAPEYGTGDGEHYVLVLVSDSAGGAVRARNAISNFDRSHFRNVPLDVKAAIFNDSTQMITVRSFENRQKAMEYYGMFKGNNSDLKGVNDQGLPFFAISAANYPRFYSAKDIAGYLEFFNKTYLDRE